MEILKNNTGIGKNFFNHQMARTTLSYYSQHKSFKEKEDWFDVNFKPHDDGIYIPNKKLKIMSWNKLPITDEEIASINEKCGHLAIVR